MNKFNSEKFKNDFFSSVFDFERQMESLWQYQLTHNKVVRTFCQELGVSDPQFIPIEFFKHLDLKTGEGWEAEMIFESSGTTGQQPSRHHVKSLDWYYKVSMAGFCTFFKEEPYYILALLPSYLERSQSSLVQMVQHWISDFGLPGSGFYLYNFDELADALDVAHKQDLPTLLIGVSFALMDFADYYHRALPANTIVMETGGMKGRREEMTKQALHYYLSERFSVDRIYSEYGMTELLSQAYSLGGGRFKTPPWMKFIISDIHLSSLPKKIGKTGRINIVDLANIDSCAFIATDDIGRAHPDGSYEILGRLDYADLRGCNLMYQ